MEQTVFDTQRKGLFRNIVSDIHIIRKNQSSSMADSHYHPYFELYYVVKGQCKIFVEHNLFVVNEGDLIILPPSTLHRSQYDQNTPVDRIILSFNEEYLLPLIKLISPSFNINIFTVGKLTFSGKARRDFLNHLLNLLEENRKSDVYKTINSHAIMLSLFAHIGRNSKNIKQEELIDITTASIQNAAKYIFENFNSEITLKQAADIAGMSETYFSRKFAEITGYGFKEYLTNIRIKKSQEILCSGKLSITQTAIACGFNDPNYFGDAFKKNTGLSPRDFRKNYKKTVRL